MTDYELKGFAFVVMKDGKIHLFPDRQKYLDFIRPDRDDMAFISVDLGQSFLDALREKGEIIAKIKEAIKNDDLYELEKEYGGLE